MSGRLWTEEDLAYLREHYTRGAAVKIGRHLDRSKEAIWQRALIEGLTTYRWKRGQCPVELVEYVRTANAAGQLDTWIARSWNAERPDQQPITREHVRYIRVHMLGGVPVSQDTLRACKQECHRKQLQTLRVGSFKEVFTRHLDREARRAGWPNTTKLERRILTLMLDGQYRSRREIAAALDQRQRSQRWWFKCRGGSKSALANLVNRGLLRRTGKQVRRGCGKGASAYEYWMPLEVLREKRRA